MLLGPLTPQDIDIASFINYRQGVDASEARHTFCI